MFWCSFASSNRASNTSEVDRYMSRCKVGNISVLSPPLGAADAVDAAEEEEEEEGGEER